MKKLLTISLALAMTLSLAACSADDARADATNWFKRTGERASEAWEVYKASTANTKGLEEYLIGLTAYFESMEIRDYHTGRKRDVRWQEVQEIVPICMEAPQLEATFDTFDAADDSRAYLYMQGITDIEQAKVKYLKIMEDNGFTVGSDKNKKRIYVWGKMDVADNKMLRINIHLYDLTHPLDHNVSITISKETRY